MSDFDERVRELLPPVVPLHAPPDAFARIARTARGRKRRRLVSSAVSGAVAVAVLGFAVRGAWTVAPAPAAGRGPRCASADLRVSGPDGSVAGPEAIGREVLVTNQGSRRCVVSGYPHVSLLPPSDAGVVEVARSGGTTLWHDPGSRPVPLDPGAAAVFGVEWAPGAARCSGSPAAIDALRVGLPGGGAPAVTLSLADAGAGTDAGCVRGGVAVTALVAEVTGLT